MPFCATCGAPVVGKFCGKCGSSVGSAASPPGAAPPGAPPSGYQAPPPGYQPAPPVYQSSGAAGLTDNAASALCYALGFITGILFLVLEPYNKNRTVRFHAFQSIFLNVALIFVAIAMGLVFAIVGSLLGFWVTYVLARILNLAYLALWVFMMVWTYQGKTVVVPVIGPIAQKQA